MFLRMRVIASKHPKKHRLVRLLLLTSALIGLSLTFVDTKTFSYSGNSESSTMQPQDLVSLAPLEEYPHGALPDGLLFDKFLLEKSQRRLTAYARGKAMRVYLVALGENPVGHKQFQGDKRTPEGNYVINDKNPNSAYYKNVGISYPNAEDIQHAQKLDKSPGGDIKIHGLAAHFAEIGSAHRSTDWTHGCVAVTNSDMDEIFLHTPVGIPINIVP
jgi:hypothetical protein